VSKVKASGQQVIGVQAPPTFEPYAVADSDRDEQQVYEFMDRPLLYVVALRRLSGIRTRRHSHVTARYSFFRESPSQTPIIPISDDLSDSNKCADVAAEFRHTVDVSDAFVKYISSGSLTIEVRSLSLRYAKALQIVC
jgi:hypothetical protein